MNDNVLDKLFLFLLQMSVPLYDLILHWPSNETDSEYTAFENLLKTEFPTQFSISLFTTVDPAIEHAKSITKSARLSIVITKLGTSDKTLGKSLIEEIRKREKHTFIILHSHTACNDPNIR